MFIRPGPINIAMCYVEKMLCGFFLHKNNKYVEEYLPTVLILKKQFAVSNILCIRKMFGCTVYSY